MLFLPDLGQGPIQAVNYFLPGSPLPAGWSLSLDLRAGFASSSFTVALPLDTFKQLKVDSVRHTVRMTMATGVYAPGGTPGQGVMTQRDFSGFVLADFAILEDTFSTPYQQVLSGEVAANVRRTSINNDATFADVLIDIDKYLGISYQSTAPYMVALLFRDIRWWWRTYAASWNAYNQCVGQVTRVPLNVRNLAEETPFFDPSFDANKADNPPETYSGQHNPAAYTAATTQQKNAIDAARKQAARFGGALATTNQLNSRPVEAQRPQTTEGARPLSWKEALSNLLIDLGAAWKTNPIGYNTVLSTIIDPTGFRAPGHPHGPPPLEPIGGNAWSQLVRFLHGTGHTLEPNFDGTFRIVEVAIDDESRVAGVDPSSGTLDQILYHSSRNRESGASQDSILPQITSPPLPHAIKVAYSPVHGEGQWRRIGRNIVTRGVHLPHVLFSTEWLLKRIYKSPYPLPLLKLASTALSNGFASQELLNLAIPKLAQEPNRGVKNIYAPISPQQPVVPITDGDDLAKPAQGTTNGDQLLSYQWGPIGPPVNGDDPPPVVVAYSHPGATDTKYQQPSWLLYPRSKSLLNPISTSKFNQALPRGLFPLAKFAQQELLSELLSSHTVVFPLHLLLLPDRYVHAIKFTYGTDKKTTCTIGVASLPEDAWPRPPMVEPPQTLFLQAIAAIPKNLTKRQQVKALYPAQTQDLTDAFGSPEVVASLTLVGPTLSPGIRPDRTPTTEPPKYDSNGNPLPNVPFDNSKPYWRVEAADLVIENLSGREIRPQELFVAHRGATDNYQILPNSGTTLAIAKAEEDFSATDLTYPASILRDFRMTRLHAASPGDEYSEEAIIDSVTVVNSYRRSGKQGNKVLVALAGQLAPWPTEVEAAAKLPRPLGELDLPYTEVWEEIAIPESTLQVQFGILATSTDAVWDNDNDAMKVETITAWPLQPISSLPLFDREASYTPGDRINLTGADYDPTVPHAHYELTLRGGKVYYAKADYGPEDWTVTHWTLCGDEGAYRADTYITGPKSFTPSDWERIVGDEFIDRDKPTVTLRHRFTNLDLEEGQLVAYVTNEVIGVTCKPVEGWE